MTEYLRRLTWRTWEPALVRSLRAYDRGAFTADLVAGVTVGVVALPLAMAFGIASGVTPQRWRSKSEWRWRRSSTSTE